ncbi:MAG: CorA family divalent cation transporter [Minisyncoccia bacterium]
MISRHSYHGGVWVDLEQPGDEEMASVVKEFSIGKRIEQEIVSPNPVPLVAADDSAVLVILHFPTPGTEDGDTGNQEIDFIVGEHFIITVRYEVVAPLYHLQKLLAAQELVSGKDPISTDILLEVLFAHLYASVRDHTNHAAARLEHVEREMFNGHENSTVRSISNINREFLHMEAALANHEEPAERFLHVLTSRGFFGETFPERAERILAERNQVARLLKTHRAVAAEMRETNTAILGARQNEIMKTLTVITFGVLPLELVALVFGMHLQGTPFEQNPDSFWIILGIMFAIALTMLLVFAKKRWIF